MTEKANGKGAALDAGVSTGPAMPGVDLSAKRAAQRKAQIASAQASLDKAKLQVKYAEDALRQARKES